MNREYRYFVMRIKNNVTLEMPENGMCLVGKYKREVKTRVVAFCDLENQSEYRLVTCLWQENRQ